MWYYRYFIVYTYIDYYQTYHWTLSNTIYNLHPCTIWKILFFSLRKIVNFQIYIFLQIKSSMYQCIPLIYLSSTDCVIISLYFFFFRRSRPVYVHTVYWSREQDIVTRMYDSNYQQRVYVRTIDALIDNDLLRPLNYYIVLTLFLVPHTTTAETWKQRAYMCLWP